MRTDLDIARDAADRLHATPGLEDQDIAIKVIDGLVLVAGIVRSDVERAQAAQVVREVRGVLGLTNGLHVWLRGDTVASDPEIAREALAAIRHQFPAHWEDLQIMVQNGRVQLDGKLDWHYQRDTVEAAVRSLRGVVLVSNRIRVHERPVDDTQGSGTAAPSRQPARRSESA